MAPASSEMQFRDEGVASLEADGGQTRPTVIVSPGPAEVAKQANKLGNVVFNSFLVAWLRRWTTPAEQLDPAPQPNASSLPSWYREGLRDQLRPRARQRQLVRDTALLTAAAYLMEGVEGVLHSLRGTDDALNKSAGGMAAGGLLGQAWFPGQPAPRLVFLGSGALVGYVSYTMQKSREAALLERQQALEKAVLGAGPDQLKQQVDVAYLQELARMRQKQLAEAAEALRKSGGGPLVAGYPVNNGSYRDGAGSPAGAAGGQGPGSPAVSMPPWLTSQPGAQPQGPDTPDTQEDGGSWPPAGAAGPFPAHDAGASPMQAPLPVRDAAAAPSWQDPWQQPRSQERGGRQPGGWGWLGGRRGGRSEGSELQIREESDAEIEANELREPAAGSMYIREEPDTRPR